MSLKSKLPYLLKATFFVSLLFCVSTTKAQMNVRLSYFNYSASLKKEANYSFDLGNAITDFDEFLSTHLYFRRDSYNYMLNVDFNDEKKPRQFAIGIGKSMGTIDVNGVLQKRIFLYEADIERSYQTFTQEVPIFQFGMTSHWSVQYQLLHVGASLGGFYGASSTFENQHLITSTTSNIRYLYEEKLKFKNVFTYQCAMELGIKLAQFRKQSLILFYEYTFRVDTFDFKNDVKEHEFTYGNQIQTTSIDNQNSYRQKQNRIGFSFL